MITKEKKIRFVVLFIMFVLLLWLHLMSRPSYDTAWGRFFNSYGIDILLPAYLFILLTINLYNLPPKIKDKQKLVKILMAAFVLMIGFTVETLQYFGVPLLGRTFDMLDYSMYFAGVLLGLIIDYLIIRISKLGTNRF